MAEHSSIQIDLEPLSTPCEECLVLRTGEVAESVVQDAERLRFDQLPVLDSRGRLCGLIETKAAADLAARGVTLEAEACSPPYEIDSRVELIFVLQALGDKRALIFRDPHGMHTDLDWFALVTISDLNRHPFRGHLYPLFAQLESALAELIDRTYPDPFPWIRRLREFRQASVVGGWELDKKHNVDTTPLPYCELTDLFDIISGSTQIRKRLSIEEGAWRKLGNTVPRLRNRVMHPVKAVVDSKLDASSLADQLQQVVSVVEVSTAAVESMRQEDRGRLRFRP